MVGSVARLILSIAVIGGSACESIVGPSPLRGDWEVHHSRRFTLYARPGSFAEQNAVSLAELLEDQYTVTTQVFGLSYNGHISGFLYSSAADAERASEGSGTAYPETAAFKSVCAPPLDGGLFGLVAHEANHVILWNGLGRAGTAFFREGLPSAVVSEHRFPAGKTFLYAWAAQNISRIPSIESLADDAMFWDYPEEVAYKSSASFLAYLIDSYGTESLKRLHGVTSPNFARRFTEVYGRTLTDVDADWRRFVTR